MPEKIKIEAEGYKCTRCEYKWVPKNIKRIPISCPKCKSPYWAKPKRKKKENEEHIRECSSDVI